MLGFSCYCKKINRGPSSFVPVPHLHKNSPFILLQLQAAYYGHCLICALFLQMTLVQASWGCCEKPDPSLSLVSILLCTFIISHLTNWGKWTFSCKVYPEVKSTIWQAKPIHENLLNSIVELPGGLRGILLAIA